MVTEDILGTWASLHSEGRTADASKELLVAQRVAKAVGTRLQEQTVAHALSAIEAAGGDKTKLKLLWEGHLADLKGAALYRKGRLQLADLQLRIAAERFRQTDSPLQYWAEAYLAELAFHRSDYSTTENLLDRIRSEANLTHYYGLNARLLTIDLRLATARGDSRAAHEAFWIATPAPEHGELSALSHLLKAESGVLHGPDWGQLGRAHHRLKDLPGSSYRPQLFRNLARALDQNPSTAIYLLDLAVADAAHLEDAALVVPLLIERMRIRSETGDLTGAREDGAQVAKALAAVEDPGRRKTLENRGHYRSLWQLA